MAPSATRPDCALLTFALSPLPLQPQPQVYVTHKLREQGAGVWSALQQGACVYVSGSAQKMPAGVVSALQDVAQEHGGLAKEEAAKYVKQLELGGRYFVEAWS